MPASAEPTAREREYVIGLLNDGLSTGRLSAEEHSQRIGQLVRLRTGAELRALVSDLQPVELRATVRRTSNRERLAGVILAVVVLAFGAGVLVEHFVPLATGPSANAPAANAPAAPATTSPTYGAAYKAPGLFCSDPGVQANYPPTIKNQPVTPDSYAWDGNFTPWLPGDAVLPASPSPSYLEDLGTVQALDDATFLLHLAWVGNDYRFSGITLSCIRSYDNAFQWRSGSVKSSGVPAISTLFNGNYTIVAARSPTGTCWYVLDVMFPDSRAHEFPTEYMDHLDERTFPLLSVSSITAEGAPAPGEYAATGPADACSASAAKQLNWLPARPVPAQLSGDPTATDVGSDPPYPIPG
ncbi:MAG TPA: DUF1707 domain-containing protein [Acidimicrobiales bacterium]|nr:DUF1707 domain-containing protein [Acidimicrobiales bacterium]